jgi:lysophospholipase
MLNNLNKTIIITGSQVPLSGENNDAFRNLLGSFRILSSFFIPEVCIFFNNKLLRGNRSRKISSTKFDGFNSTIPPLIKDDINFTINSDVFLSRKIHKSLEVWSELSDEWIFIKLTPLTLENALKNIFNQAKFRCIIIDSKSGFDSCYNDCFLLDQCKEMIENGKIILMLTNFEEENNAQIDKVHCELRSLGVVMDNSITIPAALGKVSVLLGKFKDREVIRSLLRTNLKGETDIANEVHSIKAHKPNIMKKLIMNVINLRNTEIDVFIDNIQFELELTLLSSEELMLIKSVIDLTCFTTPNNCGKTALHTLILEKSFSFLDKLGEIGVDFNYLDTDGNSCLFLCLRAKQYEKCKIIIKHGGKFIASQKQLSRVVIKAIKENDINFFK